MNKLNLLLLNIRELSPCYYYLKQFTLMLFYNLQFLISHHKCHIVNPSILPSIAFLRASVYNRSSLINEKLHRANGEISVSLKAIQIQNWLKHKSF